MKTKRVSQVLLALSLGLGLLLVGYGLLGRAEGSVAAQVAVVNSQSLIASNVVITNGDFEAGNTAPWQTYRAQLAISNEAHIGQYGGEILIPGSYNEGSIYQDIPLPVSTTVYVYVWVKVTDVSTTAVRLRLHDTTHGNTVFTTYCVPRHDRWTLWILPYTVNDTGKVRVIIDVRGPSPVYVDNIQFGPPGFTTYPDELVNGNFENRACGWCLHDKADLSSGYNSNYALRSTQTLTEGQAPAVKGFRQRLQVIPGQYYSVSVMTRFESLGGLNVKIAFYDAYEKLLNTQWIIWSGESPTGSSDGWIEQRGWVLTPPDAATSEIIIFHGVANYQNVPGSTLEIDDVAFAPAQPSGLIQNGNFEDGLLYWQSIFNVITTTDSRTGWAIQVNHNGNEANARVRQVLPVFFQPGRYRAGVWCKAEVGENCQIFFGDSTGIFPPAYDHQVSLTLPGNGDWQQLVVTLTLNTPEALSVYLYAPTPDSAVIYDDVQVERVQDVLSLHVLAFDNYPLGPVNLMPYFPDTMRAIITATLGHPDMTALVLVDLIGDNTTSLYQVRNGVVTRINGLPDASGILSPTLREYNTADGPTLGGFIRWARNTYPASKTVFSYIGHNVPLPPETASLNGLERVLFRRLAGLFPLPTHIGAEPNWTDYTSRALLSTYALAEALRIGSDDGTRPLDVVDLVQCFGASIENLYPLRNYARRIVGSPHYAYFAPSLVNAALQATDPAMSAGEMARARAQAYHAAIGAYASGHPRIIVEVDTALLEPLKHAVDSVSLYLWTGLTNPTRAADYRAKLLQAYRDSFKYDTTYCQQDWELATPDALVDLGHFAAQLQAQFGEMSPVGMAAGDVLGYHSVGVTPTFQSESPWWVSGPFWSFAGYSGLGLYADLEGRAAGNVTYLSFQAPFYTSTVTADNPHPYEFLLDGANGVTWADVFHLVWQDHAGTLATELCLPSFPPVSESGEVAALGIQFPLTGWSKVGASVTPVVLLLTEQVAYNPLVACAITMAGATVYSDIVGTGYLLPGEYRIAMEKAWTPTTTGKFTLLCQVDADDRIAESNEGNNSITFTDSVQVAPVYPRPIITATTGQQFFNQAEVSLDIAQAAETLSAPVNRLIVETYHYQTGANPGTQIPVLVDRQTLAEVSLPLADFPLALPAGAQPGVYEIYLWPRSDLGGLGYPTAVKFSYTPPATAIDINAEHYYRFYAADGDNLELTLDVLNGNAALYVWEPGNDWSALVITGSGALPLNSALAGEYVVGVRGLQAGTVYTLNATRASGLRPLARIAGDAAQWVSKARPTFIAPVVSMPRPYQVYLPLVWRAGE